jgi:hypothetical protein
LQGTVGRFCFNPKPVRSRGDMPCGRVAPQADSSTLPERRPNRAWVLRMTECLRGAA